MKFRIKTMLFAVLAISVLMWMSVKIYGRYPIQMPRAPARSAGELNYSSYIGNKTVKVAAFLPSKYPCWYRSNSSPPLSASKAALIGSTKLDEIEMELSFDSIDFSSCCLTPWSPDEGYWYWVVEYNVWINSKTVAPSSDKLRLVVLMDGTCGAVTIRDAKNGDGLGDH